MASRRVVELEELRNRLREAEETLAAIRSGEVDALVVTGPSGDQVFSLHGAEQPYRIFVEQMQEGAITLTPDGTILYCNRRFAEMIRIPMQRVIGTKVMQFLRSDAQEPLAAILQDPAPAKAEFILTGGNGTLTPARLSFSRMPLDDVEAICVIVTDMTERDEKREMVQTLRELQAAQQQLRQQNEQLAYARAVAERANDAKDHFLAALSHELRTPLTPVLMTCTALEQHPCLPLDLRHDLEMMRRNIELEARLIDDLLDLTRIVHGKVDLKRQPVNLRLLLDSALEICRGEIEQKRLRIEQVRAQPLPPLEGDPVRIQQILWNLIRNAVKFTPPEGRIVIELATRDSVLDVHVTDNGIGIGPNEIDRIFLPFEQAGHEITRQFGGLGLGLAISRKLAELHGGTVTASSDGPGCGAQFTLTLPADRAPQLPRAAMSSPPRQEIERRLRILLVEDHDDTRRSMVRLLSRRHEITAVASMNDALTAADNGSFDLVISDLGLPDGSGLDLMRELRQRYALKGICLSGYGMDEDVARSLEAGFAQHLTKPINLNRLETVISELSG